jgi:hypothetical protein
MIHIPELLTVKSVRDSVAQRSHIDLNLLFQPRRFQSLPSSPQRPRPLSKVPLPALSTERRRSLPRTHRHRLAMESKNLKTFLPPVELHSTYRDQLIANSLKLLEMKRQVSSYLHKDAHYAHRLRPV